MGHRQTGPTLEPGHSRAWGQLSPAGSLGSTEPFLSDGPGCQQLLQRAALNSSTESPARVWGILSLGAPEKKIILNHNFPE